MCCIATIINSVSKFGNIDIYRCIAIVIYLDGCALAMAKCGLMFASFPIPFESTEIIHTKCTTMDGLCVFIAVLEMRETNKNPSSIWKDLCVFLFDGKEGLASNKCPTIMLSRRIGYSNCLYYIQNSLCEELSAKDNGKSIDFKKNARLEKSLNLCLDGASLE